MQINAPHFGGHRSHFSDFDSFIRQRSGGHAASNLTATSSSVPAANSATTVAPVDAATAVAKPAFDAETVSNNILSFIQQRLNKAAEQGASKQQLADLLEQARKGIGSGFGQAVDRLKSVGAFDDASSSGIGTALQKLDSGLDDLTKQFGLSTDEGAAPAVDTSSSVPAATTLDSITGASVPAAQSGTLTQLAAAYKASFSSRQSVDLVVKTADGDTVHLQLGVRDRQTVSAAYRSDANAQQLTLSSSQRSSAGLSISVDGNLDNNELSALGDLLDQIGDLADSFFSGDIGGALQQAGGLDFSNPELDSFALNLRSSVSSKAKVAAYAAVQSLADGGSAGNTTTSGTDTATASSDATPAADANANDGAPTPTASSTTNSLGLTDLFSALSSLLPKASLAHNPASLLKQLLAAHIGASDRQNNPLLSFADRLLTALGAGTSTAGSSGVGATSDSDSIAASSASDGTAAASANKTATA